MYYYAMLKELNGDLEIVGIRISSEESVANAHRVTKKQANELRKFLDVNEKIMVVNGIQFDEFAWFVKEQSELEKTKLNATNKVQAHYNFRMNTVAFFEMYNVMMINNELAARGYFITDDNREEKYIDIINSGDEKLITLLQSYLEMKDRIDPMWEYYNKVQEFKNNLDNMKTEEEIDTATEDLMSYIN